MIKEQKPPGYRNEKKTVKKRDAERRGAVEMRLQRCTALYIHDGVAVCVLFTSRFSRRQKLVLKLRLS